jgi:hypothetical protein
MAAPPAVHALDRFVVVRSTFYFQIAEYMTLVVRRWQLKALWYLLWDYHSIPLQSFWLKIEVQLSQRQLACSSSSALLLLPYATTLVI